MNLCLLSLQLRSTCLTAVRFIALALLVDLSFSEYAFAQAAAPWDYAYGADAFAGGVIQEVYCDIIGLMEGELGALVLSAAGVMAIGAAALGNYMHAKSAIMTAVGASTLAVGVSLYFGDFGCPAVANNQAAAQQQGAPQGAPPGGDPFDQD